MTERAPAAPRRLGARLTAALLGAVVVAALAATPAGAADSPLEHVLWKTNAYRAEHGLKPLYLNASITQVSQTWSASMLSSRTLSHNPSYSRQIPSGWTRAAENVGYACRWGGITANTKKIMEGWLKSAGHERNIVGDYTELGIGIAYDSGSDCVYATQNFGKYAASPSKFSIVGTVSPPSGKSISSLKGSTVVASGGGVTASASISGVSGEYVLTGLPAGTYTLLVKSAASGITSEYLRDSASSRCAARVTVSNRDLVNIDASLGTGSLAGPASSVELCDVSANSQSSYYSVFAKQIGWLADQGISTGWANGRGAYEYRPEQRVNRDVMAAFLYRLEGRPSTSADAVAMFEDVTTSTSFTKEIGWLASTGISTGWTEKDGTVDFRPLSPVNRDMMAAFLYRLAGEPAYTAPSTSPFVDVPRSHVFYKEISWLASTGITTGWSVNGKKEFRPSSAVTREQMAAFLSRYDSKF